MRIPRWLLGTLVALAAVLPASLVAQGVTTATLTGSVTGAEGPVSRARITAVHLPSGTTYRATTRSDWRRS